MVANTPDEWVTAFIANSPPILKWPAKEGGRQPGH
jgi:hypothetical protein